MKIISRQLIRRTKKKNDIFSMVFLMVMLVFYLLPSAQLTVKFYVILTASILFTGAYTVFLKEQYGIKILIGTIAISFLFYLLGDSSNLSDVIGKLYNYFVIFFPTIMLSWVLPRCSYKQRCILMFVAVALYIFVLVTTYQELLINEDATRSLEQDVSLRSRNVGTYDFVYASGALIPFIGMCITEVKQKWKKMVFVAALIAIFYFLLIAQYTIAFLASIIALLAVPMLQEKRRLYQIVYFLLIIIFVISMQPILLFVAERVPSQQMSIRLTELANFSDGGDVSGYNLAGRFGLYGQAIQAFLEHPITGNRVLTFDSHSTILAVFARLGIWGGIIFVWILRKIKRRTINVLQIQNTTWRFTPIFIYYIIMGMTNPIHAAVTTSIVVWFVIPLGISLIKEREE